MGWQFTNIGKYLVWLEEKNIRHIIPGERQYLGDEREVLNEQMIRGDDDPVKCSLLCLYQPKAK